MTHRNMLLSLLIGFSFSSYGQVRSSDGQPVKSSARSALATPRPDPFLPDSSGKKIDSIFQSQKGTFALAFKDLTTGKGLFVHERESFHAASTMKVPVLMEVYHQAALGRLALSDSLVLKNEFTSIADSS